MEVAGKVKFRKQLFPNSCGHAVIQMIIDSLLEKHTTQEQLIKEIPLETNGISLASMKIYLTTLGLTLESYASKNKSNIEHIPFNKSLVVLVTKEQGLIHFVLVEKRRFSKLLIHDPAKDNRQWLSIDEVKKKWVNLFAFVDYKEISESSGSDSSLKAYFIKQTHPSPYLIAFFLLLSLISSFASLIGGYQFRTLINIGTTSGSIYVIVFIFLYFLFALLLQKTINYFMDKIIESIYKKKVKNAFNKLALFSDFLSSPGKTKISLFSSFSDIETYLYWKLKVTLSAPFKTLISLGSLIGLIYINWNLSLITIGFSFIAIISTLLCRSLLKKKRQQTLESTNTSFAKTSLWIENLDTAILSGVNQRVAHEATWNYYRVFSQNSHTRFFHTSVSSFIATLVTLTTSSIYFLGSYLLINRSSSVEELVAVITLALSFWTNVVTVMQYMLSAPSRSMALKNVNSLSFWKGNIKHSFTNVNSLSFDVRNRSYLLRRCGKCVFIGKSGAGKTTMLNNIYNLKNVRINDKIYPNNFLKSKTIFLNNKALVFEGTVEENIISTNVSRKSTWNKSLSKYKLKSLLEECGMSLKQTLAIGGINISQGQKQVVNLLRILTRDDEVVILDEALNSISSSLKQRVFHIIEHFCKDKILIVATHDEYIQSQIQEKVLITQ